jgi:3-deoxy-D-manno-octulosonate 8-phosphate phosphatase KdsC-like HAD superfamily phosphatase
VLARAHKIKLILMDVDGTLTDSGVCPISVTKNKAARATGRLSLRDNKVTKLSFEILALA